MKTVKMLAAVVLALVLQTLLGRFFVHGRLGIDLVLVTVAYLGLTSGPIVGIFAGTLGGLAQDSLSTGIIGISGLAKTVVGFVTGTIGAQFIVSEPIPRFVVFFCAWLLQLGVVTGLELLLELRPAARTYTATLLEAAGNGLVGLVLFQLTELLPGAVERRRVARDRIPASHLRD
ncbi:MAG: rod shape-determining protein MreD [Bacteroidales bacterium]